MDTFAIPFSYIKPDSEKTGKSYPKLDAYYVQDGKDPCYLCSTNQYKTRNKFMLSIVYIHGIEPENVRVVFSEYQD